MFETKAHIHSLDGKMDTVSIVEHKDNNHVIAKYHGEYYTAIFNPFVEQFYVDDKFGHIETFNFRK